MDSSRAERRIQFCGRCGQWMFEDFRSPDGHFGLVGLADNACRAGAARAREGALHGHAIRCPSCGARHCLLDRLNSLGQPVVRV